MDRLKTILKKKGVTMAELAKCIGIERESLYSRVRDPKESTIKQVAKCLGVDPIELLEPGKDYAHFYHEGVWLGVRKK